MDHALLELLKARKAMEENDAGTRTLGACGKFVVAGFTVLEFFGSSCIMLVVLWQEFVAILPEHSELLVSTWP